MKLQYISILVLSILTFSCHKAQINNEKQIKKEDTASVALSYSINPGCSKRNELILKYNKPIEGYRVKIEWTPYESYEDHSAGLAVICFEKNGYRFSVIDSNFVSPVLTNKDRKRNIALFKNDTVINIEYSTKIIQELLRRDVPFSFSDIDFDGQKELVMNIFGEGQRHTDIFRIFKLDSVGNIVKTSKQITFQKPYIDFDGFTKFNRKNKTITNFFGGGTLDNSYETFIVDSNKVNNNNKFRLKQIVEYIDGFKKIYYTGDKLTERSNFLKMDFEIVRKQQK
jgi:hypothetical protein